LARARIDGAFGGLTLFASASNEIELITTHRRPRAGAGACP
jgi:hypothetical protein